MKLFFFTVFSAFFLAFAPGQAKANLLEKWKLENPTTTFDSESNKFTLAYDLHTSITEDNIQVKIFTEGCQNPVDGTKAIEVADGIIVKNPGVLDSKGTFEFTLDIATLTNNDDVFDLSDPKKPAIKLCARYMLWTPGGAYEVNFIESLLTLNFDLNDVGFVFSTFVSKDFDSSGVVIS